MDATLPNRAAPEQAEIQFEERGNSRALVFPSEYLQHPDSGGKHYEYAHRGCQLSAYVGA